MSNVFIGKPQLLFYLQVFLGFYCRQQRLSKGMLLLHLETQTPVNATVLVELSIRLAQSGLNSTALSWYTWRILFQCSCLKMCSRFSKTIGIMSIQLCKGVVSPIPRTINNSYLSTQFASVFSK